MSDITLILNSEIQDLLRVSGIKSKGFGILSKYAMLDRDLSIDAKTIYAYLCSLTGAGDTVYPSRERILADLKMSKSGYYTHFALLKEQGYITVSQQRNKGSQFNHNVYTIESNPKKFESYAEHSDSKIYSKIRLSGLESSGYGFIPRAIMVDERLEYKSKGIYAYFCVFTGSGNNAFPKLKNLLYHLDIAQATYYKFYNALLDLNYIQVVQRHVNGRLSVNDYYLMQNPDVENAMRKQIAKIQDTDETLDMSESLQIAKIQDTDETLDMSESLQVAKIQDTEIQDTEIQDTEIQDTAIQDTEKQDTTSTSITIPNNYLSLSEQNINQSIHQQTPSAVPALPVTDGMTDAEYRKIIFNELWENKGIPYHYKNDERALKTAITILLNCESDHIDPFLEQMNEESRVRHQANQAFVKYGQRLKYFDGDKNDLHYLLTDALIDLCSFDGNRQINTMVITYAKVIEKINENIEFSNADRPIMAGERYMALEISDDVITTYLEAAAGTTIKIPFKYMQAIIWSRLIEKSAKAIAEVRRW